MFRRLISKWVTMKMIWSVLSMAVVVTPVCGIAFAADESRTVIDNPRGGCYLRPFGTQEGEQWAQTCDWSQFGVYFGLSNVPFHRLPGNALKGAQGRLHYHGLEKTTDGTNPDFYLFPSIKGHAFEADEIRKGRKPFWWTATYQGRSLPVCNGLNWKPFGCKGQGLNLSDDRFIKFFIHEYERGIEMQPGVRTGMSQWVTGLDGMFDFIYQKVSYFGIFDDNGTFHRLSDIGVTHLDEPFPQNDTECLENLAYCMNKLNEWAPDLRLIPNGAALRDLIDDWSMYDKIYSNIYGFLLEDFCGGTRSYKEAGQCQYFHNLNYERNVWPNMINKIQLYHVRGCENPEQLQDAYIAHLICGGPNRFFGPFIPGEFEVDPKLYADMKNAIGEPIGMPSATSLDGANQQWLYSRKTQGGWIYFNNSISSRKVTLPDSTTWYNREGNKVKELTLPAGAGDYVKSIPGQRCAAVMINPRYAETITGPVTITMSTDPWTKGATIRYATDGRDPGPNSPVYNKPFTINSGCTVKAYATKPGLANSFVSAARYNIVGSVPKVRFHLTKDGMSQFLDYYPLVKLDHPSSKPITIRYTVTGGTAICGTHYDLYNAKNTEILPVGQAGTLTIPAGDKYGHFHIKVNNGTVTGGDKTINIALSNPTNAKLGIDSTFTYTIQE